MKPSRCKKFFLIYALCIGIIGLLVYEGNNYVDRQTSTTITPLQIGLEDVQLDRTLNSFLKGRIVNNASHGTVKEVHLRLTVRKAGDQPHDTPPAILGIQDFTVITHLGPGEHKELIQKIAVPDMTSKEPIAWDLHIVSVKTSLWD